MPFKPHNSTGREGSLHGLSTLQGRERVEKVRTSKSMARGAARPRPMLGPARPVLGETAREMLSRSAFLADLFPVADGEREDLLRSRGDAVLRPVLPRGRQQRADVPEQQEDQ